MIIFFQSTKKSLTLKIYLPKTFSMTTAALSTLLSARDPDPVEVLNPGSASPVFLLCEHAGKAIPGVLDELGLDRDVIESHRGWDIGAENLARRLADRLGAPLVLQRYSRLVIDSNRRPGGHGSIPDISDGVAIPGNRNVPAWQQAARIDEIFTPLDQAISTNLNKHPRACAFSIHSFTPQFGGEARPWHAGFLARTQLGAAEHLMSHVQAAAPETVLALNQPYRIEDETDWFIPVHVEPLDIHHCLIEIRNDQIDTDAGAERWANLLSDAIRDLLESLS